MRTGGTEVAGLELRAPVDGRDEEILSADALAFVAELHRRFDGTRRELLAARVERQARIDAGELPDFLPETREVRESDWRVAPVPADLQDRRVEITGPVDRKMVINALNSGARCFMADFEDANSPTWRNNLDGQANLIDAIERTIELDTGEKTLPPRRRPGRPARPPARLAPRRSATSLVDGDPVSGSLFDFGLYLFHNGRRLLDKGSGPYLYLPKLESHLEARLWNDVFVFAEEELDLPPGSIKATVLIETILAAFEMEEILYELRDHSAGLNAGRWDYIFSIIKKFRENGRVRAPRSRAGDHDGPVHARLHRAPREDVPPPWRPRDGRHGGVRPEPARPRGQRGRAGQGSGRQAARGRRRLRRHVGRPSGSRAGGDARSSTRCSARGRTRSSACARRSTLRRPTSSTCASPGARSPTRACA